MRVRANFKLFKLELCLSYKTPVLGRMYGRVTQNRMYDWYWKNSDSARERNAEQ